MGADARPGSSGDAHPATSAVSPRPPGAPARPAPVRIESAALGRVAFLWGSFSPWRLQGLLVHSLWEVLGGSPEKAPCKACRKRLSSNEVQTTSRGSPGSTDPRLALADGAMHLSARSRTWVRALEFELTDPRTPKSPEPRSASLSPESRWGLLSPRGPASQRSSSGAQLRLPSASVAAPKAGHLSRSTSFQA